MDAGCWTKLRVLRIFGISLFPMQKFSRLAILCLSGFHLYSCGSDPEPVDCEKSGPIISLGVVIDATSCSIADGSIKASGGGGKEPYIFSVNDQPGQAEGQFNGLSPGIYTVTVTDANGCSASVNNVTIKASDFTFTADITADNSCSAGNGSVVVEVTDGSPPYTFKIGEESFNENNTFNGLDIGNHTIYIKDNLDCIVNLTVTVPRGFTGVSWENEILPIIETSCALARCHNGTDRPDLTKYENALFYAKSMKSKTQDKSMPREGTLSASQINLIACWVDDGALEN